MKAKAHRKSEEVLSSPVETKHYMGNALADAFAHRGAIVQAAGREKLDNADLLKARAYKIVQRATLCKQLDSEEIK